MKTNANVIVQYLLVFLLFLTRLAYAENSPERATKESPWTNSLGMEFVPAGSPNVLFCIWDVRVKDWRIFASRKEYSGSDEWTHPFEPNFRQTEDDPVVCISWNEAKAFCKWLTKQEHFLKILDESWIYTFPTDQEWTQALNLQDPNSGYPWGKAWPPPEGTANIPPQKGNKFVYTSPVGAFRPNPFGLFDMAGNVFQFCVDDWEHGKCVRGSCWGGFPDEIQDTSWFYRASARYVIKVDQRFPEHGFRCVLRKK